MKVCKEGYGSSGDAYRLGENKSMEQSENLLTRINQQYGKLSKGQKRLAAYITDNYDKAVFLTAAKLGSEVGVSESTTVRFAAQLGYRGFPEFHRALEELVINKLNSIQRMEVTYGRCRRRKFWIKYFRLISTRSN